MESKQPKAWAPESLILLVAASLYGVPGSQAQESFEGTHWLCFIQAPNPDPSVGASGLGSYENVAFPMVDRYFSGRCQFQEKWGILIKVTLTNNCPRKYSGPTRWKLYVNFLTWSSWWAQVSVELLPTPARAQADWSLAIICMCGFAVPLEGWKGKRPWRRITRKVFLGSDWEWWTSLTFHQYSLVTWPPPTAGEAEKCCSWLAATSQHLCYALEGEPHIPDGTAYCLQPKWEAWEPLLPTSLSL